MKKRYIFAILTILAVILASFGIYKLINNSKNKASRPAPQVILNTIGEDDIIWTFEAPGRIVSKYQVKVLARISGYLKESMFKEGDYVKAGQVLFKIEPDEFNNAAQMADANVKNIQARLTYAEKQLQRAEELIKNDYISRAQYDEMLANRDSLRAELASAKASNSDKQRILGYTDVKSPVDGRVGLITVTLGNYVNSTSGALTTINSMNPIYVTFPMDTWDFATLKQTDKGNDKNRKVELYFSSGMKYELDGTQDFHDNKVDEATGTVTMRATFDNPDNILLHGEFVNVKLYSNNTVKVPVVPQVAIQENQAGKYVYKVDENNIANLVYIKTGIQKGENWVVTEGLKVGDRVVVDGLQKVMPGAPITEITEEDKAKMTSTEKNEKKSKKGHK